MKIEIHKISNPELVKKSYQMRIEFREAFSDSDYEQRLISDLDMEWEKIGVHYLWHIGDKFADGFFDDFNEMKISLNNIIEATKKVLDNYDEKILSVNFKDIN